MSASPLHQTAAHPVLQPKGGVQPQGVLKLEGVEKSFGANKVLQGVDLSISAGEIVVLMGANGAGKSTLVKIIAGVHDADTGSIALDGVAFNPSSPAEAIRSGVCIVHQSINDGVAPDLSVAQNLLLDRLCNGETGFFFTPGKARKEAQTIAATLELDLDLDRPVRELNLADRQLVSISRALAQKPKLLILDEPTSSLSQREAERLFTIVEGLRASGVAILYISHRMSDIRRLADRIIALRDGRITGTFEKPLNYEAAVNAMLGHGLLATRNQGGERGEHLFEARDIVLKNGSAPFSFALARGEIVALTGLVGTGKSELGECMFGVRKPLSGAFELLGKTYDPASPGEAIAKGVFMAAKDRANSSIIPGFDIARNLTLPFLTSFSTMGTLNRRRENQSARIMIDQLDVVCQSEQDMLSALSGGNQQKVVIARWLSQPSRVLVLDEPFQGVDIRARGDIGRKLRETAQERATLILTAELDEALEVADRILVMSNHTIVGEHRTADLDMDALLAQISGASVIAQQAASVSDAAHGN